MIKFFRHIRQNLMMKNLSAGQAGQTGRYFKYAVGEIILVVIGILIAVQINNWNEERLKSSRETAILESIHKEFKQNKNQLDTVVKHHKISRDNCAKIMNRFPITSKPKPAVLDSLGHELFWSYGGRTFNPSQASINALSSTSSFDIISNEKLRDLLISWNDLITDYQEEELRSLYHMTNQYDPYMAKNFDWRFNFSDQRNNFDALQTLQFEYLVRNHHFLLNQILINVGELQKVQAVLDDIIKLSQPDSN